MKIVVGVFALFTLITTGCSKSGVNSNQLTPGKSVLNVSLLDAPANFSKVLVDIKQVSVLVDTSTRQEADDDQHQWDAGWHGHGRSAKDSSLIWDTLSITPGVYDLLQLRNGSDTLLGSGAYPSGKILKIKMELGTNNSVYTDSVTAVPLNILGPDQTVTVNVRKEHVHTVSNGDFKLWVDFNVNQSIVQRNGAYYLRPHLVTFNDQQCAKLSGNVLPGGSCALVEAVMNTDTLYSKPNDDGHYMLRGVKAGKYDLTFRGRNGYLDTTINGIVVDSMKTTIIPDIHLHK